jgi:hypothetical protein
MALMVTLRHVLLVEEMGIKMWGRPPHQNQFFRLVLFDNLDWALHKTDLAALRMPAFVLVPPLAAFAACCWLARAAGGRYLSYALVNLALTASTLTFGLMNEIRVWVDLLPVVVMATCVALARADAARHPVPL